ncbi:MAG: hypothetical protein KF861_06895 [Planctomycetaceae bacterium]|nr:hypothetical protein [Planctomycetaceae bacterium]
MRHPLAAFILLLLMASSVDAQLDVTNDSSPPLSPSDSERARKTIIEFELLAEGPLSGGLHAHEWGELLQKFGASVQVRQPRPEDKPGVSEKTRGSLRWVTVVSMLDEGGRMVLPDRRLTRSDTELLREWIDELKLYGAQGAPDGKPLWGLSKSQFQVVFSSLSQPISEIAAGDGLEQALARLNIPAVHPVRFHSSARDVLSQSTSTPLVRQAFAGISCGTGLAAILADCGLGFRPLRTPQGDIELVVQPLADISDAWPVGWEPPKDVTRLKLAPTLFKILPVEFDEVALEDVFEDIAHASGVPIIVDHHAVQKKGIDLMGTTLSYPSRRVAWMQVLHSAAVRHGMTEKLRVDEIGRPFVQITVFVPRPQSD